MAFASEEPSMVFKKVDKKQFECLTKNIFFEARGQDITEKQMVANVVINRQEAFGFPSKTCDIIYEDSQFSWTKERHNLKKLLKNPKESQAYKDSQKVAYFALQGRLEDLTGGALFYHAKYVKPAWNYKKLTITARSGASIWYAPKSIR